MNGVKKLLCSFSNFNFANSSSEGGFSGVLYTDQPTDAMEQNAPIKTNNKPM